MHALRSGHTLGGVLEDAHSTSFLNLMHALCTEAEEDHKGDNIMKIPFIMDCIYGKCIEIKRDRIVYYERDRTFKLSWKDALEKRKEEFREASKNEPVYKERLEDFIKNFDKYLEPFEVFGLYVVNIGGQDYSFYTFEN